MPGLGGIYIKGDSIVIFAPPELSRGRALSAIASGVVTLGIDESTRAQMVRGERIRIRPSQYAFSQLVSWVKNGVGGALRLPEVTGVDANEMTNRVTIFVDNASAVQKVIEAASAGGVPRGAIEVKVSRAFATTGLRDPWTIGAGGIEIENETGHNCSLGYNDTYQDIKGFWTAGHCSEHPGEGTLGEIIYQPTYGYGRIGSVVMALPWNSADSGCLSTLCTEADAMYVAYTDSSRWYHEVARMDGLSTVASDSSFYIGSVQDLWTNVDLNTFNSEYWAGIAVDKVGKSSGWSRGKLSETCVNRKFNEVADTALVYTVICVSLVVPDTLSGGAINVPYFGGWDSGGPVFISNNNASTQLKALGIMVGGDFGEHNVTFGDGLDPHCTFSDCTYYFERLSRIKMFIHPTY